MGEEPLTLGGLEADIEHPGISANCCLLSPPAGARLQGQRSHGPGPVLLCPTFLPAVLKEDLDLLGTKEGLAGAAWPLSMFQPNKPRSPEG